MAPFSSFFVSGTVLVLHLVSHLILITTLHDRCHHPLFRERGLEELGHLPEVFQASCLYTFPF